MTAGALAWPHMERVWAWLVHAYTTAGVVLALLMVHFAYQGEVRTVLWLFLAAMVVDGTDGMLARRWRVKELVPWFDGALLDNIVDYITYAFAPMVLLWTCGYLPERSLGRRGGRPAAGGLVLPVLPHRREDRRPLLHGVPELLEHRGLLRRRLRAREVATTAVLLALTVLIFVPIKYVYPSRTETLWYTNMALATALLVLFGAITSQLPDVPFVLTGLSLAYLAYYVAISLWLTLRTGNSVADAGG